MLHHVIISFHEQNLIYFYFLFSCMDVQTSLALYSWQRLITFSSSRIKVKGLHEKLCDEVYYDLNLLIFSTGKVDFNPVLSYHYSMYAEHRKYMYNVYNLLKMYLQCDHTTWLWHLFLVNKLTDSNLKIYTGRTNKCGE